MATPFERQRRYAKTDEGCRSRRRRLSILSKSPDLQLAPAFAGASLLRGLSNALRCNLHEPSAICLICGWRVRYQLDAVAYGEWLAGKTSNAGALPRNPESRRNFRISCLRASILVGSLLRDPLRDTG